MVLTPDELEDQHNEGKCIFDPINWELIKPAMKAIGHVEVPAGEGRIRLPKGAKPLKVMPWLDSMLLFYEWRTGPPLKMPWRNYRIVTTRPGRAEAAGLSDRFEYIYTVDDGIGL